MGLGSKGTKQAVIAVFHVDLKKKIVVSFRHTVFVPLRAARSVSSAGELKTTTYENGKVVDEAVLGEDYIITSDGRRLNAQQLEGEARKRERESAAQAPQRTPQSLYSDCVRRRGNFCYYSTTTFCGFVKRYNLGARIACWLYWDKRSGCFALARRTCYIDYCSGSYCR